jgi:hypothetical protein
VTLSHSSSVSIKIGLNKEIKSYGITVCGINVIMQNGLFVAMIATVMSNTKLNLTIWSLRL